MAFELHITTLEEFIKFMEFVFPDRIITAQVKELKKSDEQLTLALEGDKNAPSN